MKTKLRIKGMTGTRGFGLDIVMLTGDNEAIVAAMSGWAIENKKCLPLHPGRRKTTIKEETTMEMVIHVEGMMCKHCKARVESVCKAVPGVADAVVDLEAKTVTVSGTADVQAVKKAIADADYQVVE